MKGYLIIAVAVLTALVWLQTSRLRTAKADRDRLSANQTALMSDVERYRTRDSLSAASVQTLRLRCGEFETLRAADAAAIRELGIKLKRVEATAKTAAATIFELRARLRDTIVMRTDPEGPAADTLQTFRWRDPWVTVHGLIRGEGEAADSGRWIECRVESTDTLRQIVHRIPHRFLFFRWGTKAVRQEIISSNPHTKILYTEYVELNKRKS